LEQEGSKAKIKYQKSKLQCKIQNEKYEARNKLIIREVGMKVVEY